jgi:hypothetical protein
MSGEIKRRIMALVLTSAFLVSIEGSVPPALAQPVVVLTSASYGALGDFNGVNASLTSYWASSLDLVVFAVWKNSVDQTVAVSTGGLTMATSATGTAFAPLTDPLASGSYTVIVFAVGTNNDPDSLPMTIAISVAA